MNLDSGWHSYVSDDQRFECWLPASAQLSLFLDATPGEKFYSWSPAPDLGTFSILRQPLPGQTPEDMLHHEAEIGAEVTVDEDSTEHIQGLPVRRLHYRSRRYMPREILIDPETGQQSHSSASWREEQVKFLYWQTQDEMIKSGFRISNQAPGEVKAIFEKILSSFRLLGMQGDERVEER